MSKVFILQSIICLAAYSIPAFARDKPRYQPKKWQKKPKSTLKSYSKPRYQRKMPLQHRKNGLGLNLGFTYANFGYGLEYYYSANPKIQTGVQLLTTTVNLKGGTYEGGLKEFTSLTLYNTNIFFRYLPIRFFYIGGGLNFDSMTGQYGFENTNSQGDLEVSYRSTQLRLHGSIGSEFRINRWFMLAVDWLGYSQSLTHSVNAGNNETLEQTIAFHQSTTVSDRIKNELTLQTQFYFLLGRIIFNF